MREAGFDENGQPIGQQIRQELGMNEIEEAEQASRMISTKPLLI